MSNEVEPGLLEIADEAQAQADRAISKLEGIRAMYSTRGNNDVEKEDEAEPVREARETEARTRSDDG